MGEPEGSSIAAHRAHDEEVKTERGFFGRIFEALSPNDMGDDTPEIGDANGSPQTQNMPLGMGNLRRMRVEDVAVPRAEIAGLSLDSDLDSVVAVFREKGYSRLPVYDGTLDAPTGMVHLKDLALSHGFNGKKDDFDLRAMLRPLLYVPPSMPLGVLFQKMKSDRVHMALVIDEYGGVDGLLTIEDLIEQVLGDIEDEHDAVEAATWYAESSGTYIAQARAPLEEFEAEIEMQLHDPKEDDEVDTLGGLIFLLAGRVPARGEVICHPDGPEFEVIDADPRRIKRMRIRIPSKAA